MYLYNIQFLYYSISWPIVASISSLQNVLYLQFDMIVDCNFNFFFSPHFNQYLLMTNCVNIQPFNEYQNSVSPQGESNSRPLVYKTSALTAELWRRCGRGLETVGSEVYGLCLNTEKKFLTCNFHMKFNKTYFVHIQGFYKRISAFNKI